LFAVPVKLDPVVAMAEDLFDYLTGKRRPVNKIVYMASLIVNQYLVVSTWLV
jgi:hypothetical protein